ncbi:MAG TPA: RNase adapter RapZ [Candidatus Limnocylindria bacterium]|nr:RNase adapter RapZ [Candidatus Limnocylindria bacterium]
MAEQHLTQPARRSLAGDREPLAGGHPEPAPHVVIITGLSGAGKTAASKLLEDLGYTVVDNLPSELLRDLAELVAAEPERFHRLALVLDARAADVPLAFAAALGALEGRGIQPQIFFLEARDDVLIRRFSETRRPHPMDRGEGLAAAIKRERELLSDMRAHSDVVLDTSDLSGRQLRERLQAALDVAPDRKGIELQLISFGYKHGLPLEADVVFDVRFMENPFYIDALRPLSGLDPKVSAFVLGQPVTERFLQFVREYFEFALPAYEAEGKGRLTVGIGCTGGYHRSIAISEEIASQWRAAGGGPVKVWHRELERA